MTVSNIPTAVVDEKEIDLIEAWCEEPDADCVEIVDHAVPALIGALREARVALAEVVIISTTIDNPKNHVSRMSEVARTSLGSEDHRAILIAEARRNTTIEPAGTAESIADGLYEQALGR
jgi:hypothetical protein